MTITIDTTVKFNIVTLSLIDWHGERMTKQFALDPEMIDADIDTLLTKFASLSNAGIVKGRVNGRKILGLTGTPTNSQYDMISAVCILSFNRVSPLNAELTLWREFIIPAAVAALLQEDGVSLVEPDDGGTDTQKALFALTASLETNLAAYIKSDDYAVIGNWVYQPAKSGFETFGRKYDGQPG